MKCKTALNRSNLYGLDYTINPYYGCSHACIYCYVPSLFHVSYEEWKIAKPKENIVEVLRKEIRKRKKGIVGISTATDAYQPMEKKYMLTRKILNLLQQYNFPIDIQTKSPLVIRDVDIIKKFDYATVGITITTFNEEVYKKWEPYAPPPFKRIDAIKRLADEGIHVYAFFGPVYPLMKADELHSAMEEFINAGAEEIIVDKLHVKAGMEDRIRRKFPYDYKRILKNENFSMLLREMRKYERKIPIKMAWY